MINAADIKSQRFLDQIPAKKYSEVNLYRIATHFKDINKSIQIGISLKKRLLSWHKFNANIKL